MQPLLLVLHMQVWLWERCRQPWQLGEQRGRGVHGKMRVVHGMQVKQHKSEGGWRQHVDHSHSHSHSQDQVFHASACWALAPQLQALQLQPGW